MDAAKYDGPGWHAGIIDGKNQGSVYILLGVDFNSGLGVCWAKVANAIMTWSRVWCGSQHGVGCCS